MMKPYEPTSHATHKPGMPAEAKLTLLMTGCLLTACVLLPLSDHLDQTGHVPYAIVGTAIGVIALVLTPCLIPVLFVLHVLRRRRRQQSLHVLEILNQVIQLNLPLPDVLQSTAVGHYSWASRTIKQMAKALRLGASLEDAMMPLRPYVDHRVLDQIGLAERMGKLRDMLPWIIAQPRQTYDNQPFKIHSSYVYLFFTAALCLILFSLQHLLIAPRLLRISDDYGVDTPLQALPSSASFIAIGLGLLVLLVGSITHAIVINPNSRLIEHLGCLLPGVRHWILDRQLGQACRLVAQGMQAGIPMYHAVTQTCDVAYARPVRSRLMRWTSHLSQGQSPADAARDAQLPPLVSNLLAGNASSTADAQTLDFIASYYLTRYERRMGLVRTLAEPVATLLIGLLVGLMAYLVFSYIPIMIWAGVHQSGVY